MHGCVASIVGGVDWQASVEQGVALVGDGLEGRRWVLHWSGGASKRGSSSQGVVQGGGAVRAAPGRQVDNVGSHKRVNSVR